jgi:type IV secretory pathway TrbD component
MFHKHKRVANVAADPHASQPDLRALERKGVAAPKRLIAGDDDLAAVRGLCCGVILGVLAWIGLGLGTWLLLALLT